MLGGKTYTWRLSEGKTWNFFFFLWICVWNIPLTYLLFILSADQNPHLHTKLFLYKLQDKPETWAGGNCATSALSSHAALQLGQLWTNKLNILCFLGSYCVPLQSITPCGWPYLVLCEAERTRWLPDVPSDLRYSMASWSWNYVNSLVSCCPCKCLSTEIQMFFSRCSYKDGKAHWINPTPYPHSLSTVNLTQTNDLKVYTLHYIPKIAC